MLVKKEYLKYWRQEFEEMITLKAIWRGFVTCAKAYLMFLAVLIPLQRGFIYHPSVNMIATPQEFGAEGVAYKSADGISLSSWYTAPKNNMPVIVMFHGNAGNISHRGFKLKFFADKGYGFFLAEYRGYGDNRGGVSENGFYADARASMQWLKNEKQVDEKNIIIYGESIGTGVAAQMALEYKNVKALILEAPLRNVADVAVAKMPWVYPVKYFLLDNYQTILKAPYFKMPLLVVHGDLDEVIPVEHGRDIYAAAGSVKKEIEIVKGGHHSDLANYGLLARMENFVQRL